MFHMAYSYNTPYRIQHVFYRIEQIGPYSTIAKFALFCRFFAVLVPPQQRSFGKLPMLLYTISITYNILEKNWERFG